MRDLVPVIFCLTLFAVSCKKTSPDAQIPQGTYIGTFQRLTPGGGHLSNVTITFSAKSWSGQSQFSKYPALCHGKFTSNGTDSITFENACAWTTEFDWTLILSGKYGLNLNGDTIEISKDYNGVFKDIYKLTRQ